MQIDFIAGLDARGFVIGTPLSLALNIPFVMVRKEGKLPNATTGGEFFKEYKGDNNVGGDVFCIPIGIITPGSRVLVIDDLLATGVSSDYINVI
jgi:adenine phosphoribosyltransferase